MNNNRNSNNNNFPSPQGDYLVLYIENVINTAILLRNRSQRVNPSRDWSPRLIPSCKLYRGPVPATGPCDQSLRLVPSCVATFTGLSWQKSIFGFFVSLGAKYPCDLRSMIQFWIFPKKRTLIQLFVHGSRLS